MYINENTLESNSSLRLRARESLVRCGWGRAIAAYIVPTLLTLLVQFIVMRAAAHFSGVSELLLQGNFEDALMQQKFIYHVANRLSIGAAVVGALLGFLSIGMIRFFTLSARGETPPVTIIFSLFKKWHICALLVLIQTAIAHITNVPSMLVSYFMPQNLVLYYVLYALGSLAGIFVTLRISLSSFIYAEDESIGAIGALRTSNAIMKNRGMMSKVLLLFLSFIGWLILTSCTCGIAIIFVGPYFIFTFAHLYRDIMLKSRTQM